MKVLRMVSFMIGVLLFYGCRQSTPLKQYGELKRIGTLPAVSLEKDYAYYGFDANENYLTWFEGYTSTVYIYGLSEERLSSVSIKKGSGPHELKQLAGLTISDEDVIYLSDNTNMKLIRLKPSGDYLSDVSTPSGIRPFGIFSSQNTNAIMTIDDKALYYLLQGEEFIPIEPTGNLFPDGAKGIYKKVGQITIQNDRLVHLTKYYPRLYLYDLNEKKLIKETAFDESEVEGDEGIEREDGSKVFLPPSKVDILNEDVTFIPGFDTRIFLLAKGKSDDRDYDLSELYEYDIEKEQFIGTHNLGVKAAEIAVNDKYLFVYSEEEDKIFQYQITPNN